MTYEELKIQLDINDPVEVLRSVGRPCHGWWFVICDDGDCHMFDWTGEEQDISWVKRFTESIVPTDVKRVIMPNGVKIIDDSAFEYCTSLKSIEIPSSVKSIGKWVFYNCTSLEKLAFKGKTMKQVRAMDEYPWGIEDTSIIKCA